MSKDIVGKNAMEKSVQGGEISVDQTYRVIVDNAKAVSGDIEASNGVIHVIDALIMPEI